MSDITDGLALIEQGVAKIKAASGENLPIAFTHAKLLSVEGVVGPFGLGGPWTLKFEGFQIKLQFQPETVKLTEGALYSGVYTPGSPVDILNTFAPAAIQVNAIIISIDGGKVSLVPTTGGSLVSLNLQKVPDGWKQGAVVSFAYNPASATGTGFDEIVSMG